MAPETQPALTTEVTRRKAGASEPGGLPARAKAQESASPLHDGSVTLLRTPSPPHMNPPGPGGCTSDSCMQIEKGSPVGHGEGPHSPAASLLSACQTDKPSGRVCATLNFMVAVAVIIVMTGMG